MDKCPHCGFEEYYKKVTIRGKSSFSYRFDGGEAENGDLHQTIEYKEGKTMFCVGCDKKLGIDRGN